ncbi:MAG: hypothetical protein IJ231_02270 [Clostridia bacterium]|nr:hypothetical protein [Clostridia bacterium]
MLPWFRDTPAEDPAKASSLTSASPALLRDGIARIDVPDSAATVCRILGKYGLP